MNTESKQQLLFESAEDAIIESLYSAEPEQHDAGEQFCLECDSLLELSYDNQNNPRYYCDNCGCYVKGSDILSIAEMNITQATDA